MASSVEKSAFIWVGNWPAIDFVNTEIVAEGRLVNCLETDSALWAWLGKAGLPTPELGTADRKRAFARALLYRDSMRGSLAALAAKTQLPPGTIEETNALLAEGPPVPQLSGNAGAYTLVSKTAALTPAGVLMPVALSFAKLLTEADPRRVRKCRNPECVLWFYDTSKSGTRAWCSLDMCGNKMRMAASRRRRA